MKLKMRRVIAFRYGGLLLLLLAGLSPLGLAVQKNDPNVILTIDKPRPIHRRPPRVKPRTPRAEVLTAPWLALRVQVLTLPKDVRGEPVNCNEPLAVDAATHNFVKGNWVRLAIQVNQKGYLYLVNYTEAPPGKIINGPSLISIGQYEIEKDARQMMPPTCPAKYQKCGECWFEMYDPAGREVVTLIFSRDEIPELIKQRMYDQNVSASFLDELEKSAPPTQQRVLTLAAQQRAQWTGVAGPYVTLFWNANSKNNELLIARVKLNHQ